MKDALSVNLSPAPPVTNVPSAAEGLLCWGQTGKILANLYSEGFESKGAFDLEGGVLPAVQDQTSPHQGTSDRRQISKCP